MAEEGFKIQLTLSTPPTAQYAKGNMLNLRADTVAELDAMATEAARNPVLAVFFEAAELATASASPSVPPVLPGQATISDAEALQAITRELGADPVPAEPAPVVAPAPVAAAPQPVTGPTGILFLNQPCDVCGKPRTKVIQPKPGQSFRPFAGCDVWDEAHQAAAKARKARKAG